LNPRDRLDVLARGAVVVEGVFEPGDASIGNLLVFPASVVGDLHTVCIASTLSVVESLLRSSEAGIGAWSIGSRNAAHEREEDSWKMSGDTEDSGLEIGSTVLVDECITVHIPG
jgi:hypothetical protein